MKKSSEQYRTKCPICGERYIEYKDFETDGKTGWMERWCTHCGYTWWDVFTFSHTEEISKGYNSKIG